MSSFKEIFQGFCCFQGFHTIFLRLGETEVDQKYCLFVVDLFNSKIYIYPMKNRSLLDKNLALFYENSIENKKIEKK